MHRVSQIEVDTVKTGLGGTLGNKGATGIKLKIDETQVISCSQYLSLFSLIAISPLESNKMKLGYSKSEIYMIDYFLEKSMAAFSRFSQTKLIIVSSLEI